MISNLSLKKEGKSIIYFSVYAIVKLLTILIIAVLIGVDNLMRWLWVTLRFQTTMSDSINSCFIVECLPYDRDSQSYSDSEVGQARSVSWCSCGSFSWWPVWHDDIVHWRCHPWSRTEARIAAVLMAPCTTAVCRCTWSHRQFCQRCPTSLWATQRITAPDHDPSENTSPSGAVTPAWILLQETSSYTYGCKQAENAFVAEHHLLPHLNSSSWHTTVSTGFACTSGSIGDASCEPCSPSDRNARHWWSGTHCWGAGNNLSLLPLLMQEFKRFQLAVGQ